MNEFQLDNKKFELINARLTEKDKNNLFSLCYNEEMLLTLEKVLLYQIHLMGIVKQSDKEIFDVNWAFLRHDAKTTDEELGKELKIKIAALSFLDDSFKQIKKFGLREIPPEEEVNPAV